MFKFGFSSDNENETPTVQTEPPRPKDEIVWEKSKEIYEKETNYLEDILENCEINHLQADDDREIKYLSSVDVLHVLKEKDEELAVLSAEQNHSDLLKAVYEGGLKIWECTYDLFDYIKDNKIDLTGKNVLDLGCGAGILGILAAVKNAKVYFQDYNAEVIKYATIPNVKLNLDDLSNCKFYSGDWLSFLQLITSESSIKFDYILTSETIYNVDNYSKLAEVFKTILKDSGVIYLAAKSYYFGVGGGISLFEDYLKKEHTFYIKSCWKCTEGVRREILEIKKNVT